jgi:hypothetical protein
MMKFSIVYIYIYIFFLVFREPLRSKKKSHGGPEDCKSQFCTTTSDAFLIVFDLLENDLFF